MYVGRWSENKIVFLQDFTVSTLLRAASDSWAKALPHQPPETVTMPHPASQRVCNFIGKTGCTYMEKEVK